jgi:glycerophosphoryl diester phosphodiesterase
VGARLVSLDLTQLSLDVVRRCQSAGIAVMAWTVNTAQDWALARALGLDGAATDLPEEAGA